MSDSPQIFRVHFRRMRLFSFNSAIIRGSSSLWFIFIISEFTIQCGIVSRISEKGIFSRFTTIVPRSSICECSCGISNENTRIVGGDPTGQNEYPWLVRLSYFNRFYCAGTLVNDKYVLTAAHCVKGFLWFMIKVTLGEHDRCNMTHKPETRFVIRVFAGNFSFFNFNNDIALLRLNDNVPITDTIRPACLPQNTVDSYVRKTGIVAGWGTLEENGKPACILRDVEVPILSNKKCAERYDPLLITEDMMCAGYDEGQKDSCQGDSGGPMMIVREDKRFEVIGVVSWGNGCGRPKYPGVYTRVNKYKEWIEENAKDGCFCEK